MSAAVDIAKRIYRLLRRIPVAGLVITGVVRIGKVVFLHADRGFDALADELHIVNASVHTLSVEMESLARSVAVLRAGMPEGTGTGGMPTRWPDPPVAADATAILAQGGTTPPQQIALDLRGDDRSGLIAQIAACAPAALSAATIPLSGCETPEALRELAQALGRAMHGRAILCLRLLDRLSLFVAGSRDSIGNSTAISAGLQLSPQLVLDIFERQGCRLIGLRRGTAGQWPTVDLIIEMRES